MVFCYHNNNYNYYEIIISLLLFMKRIHWIQCLIAFGDSSLNSTRDSQSRFGAWFSFYFCKMLFCCTSCIHVTAMLRFQRQIETKNLIKSKANWWKNLLELCDLNDTSTHELCKIFKLNCFSPVFLPKTFLATGADFFERGRSSGDTTTQTLPNFLLPCQLVAIANNHYCNN